MVCPSCDGKKYNVMTRGLQVFSKCNNCYGIGKIRNVRTDCPICLGNFNYTKIEHLKLNIPRGIHTDYEKCYEKFGEQADNDMEISGNLIIRIKVIEDHFNRRGNDLIYKIPITFKEAIYGKVVVIPHYEQDIELDIEKYSIIQPLREYKISGKGMTGEGDLILIFDVIYPDLSGKTKDEKIQYLIQDE
jgi:molecular chaperone DnaJ